jgi:hypothetical protein
VQQLPQALAPLAAYRQFLCYVLSPSKTKPGKMDKYPVSPHTGEVVSAHDPQHWTTADHACAVATHLGPSYGVAFSFQTTDPFFFVDIDGAYDAATGQWSQTAQTLLSWFPGAAVEVSQSGRGLHIIGTGTAPPHGKKNEALGLEFYTELRFVALTGLHAQGNAATDHTAALHHITQHIFPFVAGMDASGSWNLSTEPVPEWNGPTDDDELIRRALNSRSAAAAFGANASFADLWTANHDVLGKVYPDADRPYDANRADAALISHLSFWTGRHGERILRLLWKSGLVRDKWNRDDYLPRSIAAVLAAPGDVLTDKAPEPPAGPAATVEAPVQKDIVGNTFLGVEEQRNVFAGCVYIIDRHKVLVPGGAMLKPDQFRVAYGGYVFSMDNINERTSRNAWEAFTESQVLRAPRADTVCFRPDLPPGQIVNDAGRMKVNTYWPATVPRTVGDPSPFLRHMRNLFPVERDYMIVLSYMAAVVQMKGVKFQWAPVIQGTEGNGKTLLAAVVALAVGQHFTHWPDAKDLSNQFNGWLSDKLFIAVEELYRPENKNDVVEDLKTIVTGSFGKQIQFKGVDQTSMQICCNLMLMTNFRNAIRKTPDNGRRFAIFYTPQQHVTDLAACGMTSDYFTGPDGIVTWLKQKDGFAIVAELLHTFPIPPEYNPANMSRAPVNSSTEAVMVESRGNVEQEIAEVIAQETPGFMGGWVSSIMLDRLITETLKKGNQISRARRFEMLRSMGYILHPGLHDGRVNNPVQPDNKKPQLFILADHPHARIVGAAEIAKAYTAAQSVQPHKVQP